MPPSSPSIPFSTSKKLVEPFNRLKNRANLFRRKNYSSQTNLSSQLTNDNRLSSGTDQTVPSHRLTTNNFNRSNVIQLKRSNSMICPQRRLQTFLNQNNNHTEIYRNQRNSICLELAGCSTDESSTDDCQLNKSSTNCYSTKTICSPMAEIDENELNSSNQQQSSTIIEEVNINSPNEIDKSKTKNTNFSPFDLPFSILLKQIANQFIVFSFFCSVSSSLLNNHSNNNSEQASVILPSSKSTMDVILNEKENEEKQSESISSSPLSTKKPSSILSSSHSSSSTAISSTVILRDHAETIRTRRQCHSSISFLQQQQQQQQQQQSLSSSADEPFYDCKQQVSPKKTNLNFDMSVEKVSICTMTGKSLMNLDECSSSSEEKAVQTTLNENLNANLCVKRAISSTSLTSSSSASIQTDTFEKKSKVPISTIDETTTTTTDHLNSSHKWPHIHERLLGEQACIYWVNYLGSTAIKMLNEGTTALPAQAITRLKQSTQYARVLPIIGLSISSRGVEFLKHAKERVVICFHDIKSIHCACQDQDLRYFAYVTREQRLTNGMSQGQHSSTIDNKQHAPSSPSLSVNGSEYHHYCHVFVVKSESMSTEVRQFEKKRSEMMIDLCSVADYVNIWASI